MRVLVTGAAGYIGAVLCGRLLQAGHHVWAVDNLRYGDAPLFHLANHERFQFNNMDARTCEVLPILNFVDVVIPLAAIVGAPACDEFPDDAIETNKEAVVMLVEEMRPEQLLLYPNTNSGYGLGTGAVSCTEETPMKPISLYGQTKCEAEQIVLSRENSIALRLATVFGCSPRMRLDLLVNDFTYRAVTEGTIVLYEADFKRNYVHVQDVADAFLHCITNYFKGYNGDAMVGEAYNLGLDKANLSKLELCQLIQEHVPGLVIIESESKTDPDQRNYVVSNQKLAAKGFAAKRTVDEGVEELLKAFRMMGRSKYGNI